MIPAEHTYCDREASIRNLLFNCGGHPVLLGLLYFLLRSFALCKQDALNPPLRILGNDIRHPTSRRRDARTQLAVERGHRFAKETAGSKIVIMRPGEGERRAIGGFYAQYRVSASLILAALSKRRLRWIRLADPEAGQVDDLQIGGENRVDAYQVKWAQYGGNLSFRDLTTGAREEPSLIAQLADGWKRLSDTYRSRRIAVHLITNRMASTSDSLPAAEGAATPGHFAAFLEQAWQPVRRSSEDETVPSAWAKAWEDLRRAAGLSEEEFKNFIRDCELEFGYSSDPDFGTPEHPERGALLEELRDLIQTQFETVADPQRIIELDRAELLSRLGWAHRFEFRNRHEFPVDELLYQPIETSVQQLSRAIDILPGGYLAVLGSPGSGKSTMLTQTLRSQPERVVRYYAYVPDDRGPTTLRGESTSFLHDLTLALDDAGFGASVVRPPDDRERLLDRLHEQLRFLGEDFRSEGRKTLILVDGLDHIDREQHPNRSLLEDLPRPDQVPEGVYFILGSQTDAPFLSSVQYSVRQPERRIRMSPLARDTTMEIIRRAGLPMKLDEEQEEEIYILSDGHPLALIYLLKRLQNVTDSGAVTTVLENTERYEGDIEQQYHGHWAQIEGDDDLTNLLSLLARFRGVIDLDWVESWSDPGLLRRLRRTMAHYFRIEDDYRWYFFHNSFRLFLLRQTAEYVPGVFNNALDRSFHRQLAERCAQARRGSYWAWEELYHSAQSGDHAQVLELASQDWFRRQFMSFRPSEAINEDIRIALRSAAIREDAVSLVRLVLAAFELDQRGFYLEPQDLADILLRIGEGQVASEHVRNGRRLLVGSKEGLETSVKFARTGFTEEAQRIFGLAEPLDLLDADSPIEDNFRRAEWDLLETWSRAAIHFLNIDDLIQEIDQIQVVPDTLERMSDEEATMLLRTRMLFEAGSESIFRRDWDNVSRISDELYARPGVDRSWWFWLRVRLWRNRRAANDQAMAESIVADVMEKIDTGSLDPKAKVVLAEGVYRILGDEQSARALISGVLQPGLVEYAGRTEPAWGDFLHRFRLNRLRYVFGDHTSTEQEVVPDAPDPQDQAVVYFERALVRLSRLGGEAWLGNRMAPWDIEPIVVPLLRTFVYQYAVGWSTNARLIIGPNRSRLYKLTVEAVARHGPPAVEMLRRFFQREWEGSAGDRWPHHLRREIILALNRAGVDRGWAVAVLGALEEGPAGADDVRGRVEERRDQLKAWLTLRDRVRAYETLRGMLTRSLGVGSEDDYQMDVWIRWLGVINGVEPGRAEERIAWFSRAIAALEVEGATHVSAANGLLAVAFRWSPRRAIVLFRWFVGKGIVGQAGAIKEILREALRVASPPVHHVLVCLSNIVFPVTTRADTALAKLLVVRTATVFGEDAALEMAQSLTDKVRIHALDTTRSGWLYGVAQALEELGKDSTQIQIEPSEVQPARNDELSSRLLKLRDGVALNVGEVKERIASTSDISSLFDEEADDSYFDWEPIVIHLARQADQDQVRGLATLFSGRRREAQVFATLSRRMQDLGNADEAWSLGMQALEVSRELGWDRWYDGGSRLAAFGALAHSDPDRAYRLAFATLVKDLTGEARYPRNFAFNLDRILPILTSYVPVREAWSEVRQYLDALLEGSPLPPDGPDGLAEQLSDDTAEMAIADLVTFHMTHPIDALSRGARRAAGELLLGETGSSDT